MLLFFSSHCNEEKDNNENRKFSIHKLREKIVNKFAKDEEIVKEKKLRFMNGTMEIKHEPSSAIDFNREPFTSYNFISVSAIHLLAIYIF